MVALQVIRREHKIIAVAAGIGLAVSGSLWWVDKASVKLVPVVVATRDLPARTTLKAGDLTIRPLPPASMDTQAIHQVDQLVGKTLVSPVFAGEQFRPTRVAVNVGELAPDEVAMGFKTDLINSVGGILNAGDVVDMYVVPGDANGQAAQGRKVEVFKVGSGYRVFSVRDGNAKETGPAVNGADPTRTQGQAGIPAVVDLKVPTEHVAALKQAASLGMISFVKRSSNSTVPDRPFLVPLPVITMQVDVRGVPLSTAPGSPNGQPPVPPGQGPTPPQTAPASENGGAR